MEKIVIRVPDWKKEKGKCLNCGKLTHFYDEGYYCTNKCRMEHLGGISYEKKFTDLSNN